MPGRWAKLAKRSHVIYLWSLVRTDQRACWGLCSRKNWPSAVSRAEDVAAVTAFPSASTLNRGTCTVIAPPCLWIWQETWRSEVLTASAHCCPGEMLAQTYGRGTSLGRPRFLFNGSWQKLTSETKTLSWVRLWVPGCLRPSCPGWVIVVTICVWIQRQMNLFSSGEQISVNPHFSALYPCIGLLCASFSASSFYFRFSKDSKVDLGPTWVISPPWYHHPESFSSAVFYEDNTAYKATDESSKQKTFYERAFEWDYKNRFNAMLVVWLVLGHVTTSSSLQSIFSQK